MQNPILTLQDEAYAAQKANKAIKTIYNLIGEQDCEMSEFSKSQLIIECLLELREEERLFVLLN
ncbi:MAG: hypothetical protein M3342_04045 [Bacteroidota bacterium]|nr:hypothetical protein [Flavisolibacter sp.]MBD0377530.1 hypothetical protein [Flavisolibacter sp.]MDQ3843172.1 hypothetical protein [Bacteroidota bacterium]